MSNAPIPEGIVAADPDLAPGTVVGEYRIEGKLGAGGFGAVYKAVHPLIGKPAAIKVLHRQFSANAEMVERFVSEARAVNQIRHRGIIDIFSFGTLADGRQYYVMELLDGSTLDELLRARGKIGVDQALPILRGIARALDAAHAAGIAHRDLKPENVFLTFDDEGRPVPKLLDFGIAKLLDPGSKPRTQTGTPMGTPHYMSPEQARGVGVDQRTDVYSFGVMTFEMLTGALPFSGDAMMDILLKQITEAPPKPSAVCADVPASLDGAILHMLAKDAADRPATLTAAVDELTVAAGQPIPRATPSTSDLAQSLRDVASGGGKDSAIATAKTVAQPTGPTFVGSTSEVGAPPPKKQRGWLLGVVAVAALALGGGIVVLAAGSGRAKGGGGAISATGTTATAPVASSVAAVASSVAPLVHVAPDVAITLHGVPEGTEVWLGEEKLGLAPGAVRVPRGAGVVKLTLKAKGHKPKDVDVTATSDQSLSVTLEKATAGAGAGSANGHGGTHPELENPF